MKIIQNDNEEIIVDNSKNEFDPGKFFFKIVKFWPIIFLSMAVTLTAAYFYNKSLPSEYQVSSKFFVKEQGVNLGILNLTGSSNSNYGTQMQKIANEAIFLSSKPMANKVLDILDFSVDYYQPGFLVDKELYKNTPFQVEVDWNHPQIIGNRIDISWNDLNTYTLKFPHDLYFQFLPDGTKPMGLDLSELGAKKFNFGEWVELPQARFKINLITASPEGKNSIQFRSRRELLAKYTGAKNLEVLPLQQQSSILGLTLKTTHPQKGSDYLNLLMELYLEEELNEKNMMAKNTVDFIDSQISGVSDTLSFFEGRLQNFRSSNRTYNISSESDAVYAEITELERQLSREKYNQQYYQNLQNYLKRESYDQIIMPSGIGIEDPILNKLIGDLAVLQNEKSRLLLTQREASPLLADLNTKIQNTNASLQEVLKNVNQNSDFLIRDLEERVGKIDMQFSKLPATEQNLLKIQREFTLNESIYTFLLQRRAEAAIAMASNMASNKIVEYSDPNATPITLTKTIVYMGAFFAGLIVPIIAIVLIFFVDSRIKDTKELEDNLVVPLLGKIGKAKTASSLSVFLEPRSALAESFRYLKTNISFVVPNDNQLTIAISSSVSREGKTYTAINLASIYSRNNRKTVLVGCDMFKSNTFKVFDLKGQYGLSNYLSKQVNGINDVIQSTSYPLLDVITAGTVPPNPSELMALGRFREFMDELKKIYDVVILDTPPVGLVSQSFEILKNVDMTLYIMRFKFSQNAFIEDLNNIKTKKGIKNIYAVVNDVPEKEMNYKGYDNTYYQPSKSKKSFLGNIFNRNKAAL